MVSGSGVSGLDAGGYRRDALGAVPGSSRLQPQEDPGERVVQSFTAPRTDSRATAVDRPATGLLLSNGGVDPLGYGSYSGSYGGAPRSNGLGAPLYFPTGGGIMGLGQTEGEPVYGDGGYSINISEPLNKAGATADFSGAVIVTHQKFMEAANVLKNAIPNTRIVTVPPVWETNADTVRGTPEYLPTLKNELPQVKKLIDETKPKKILFIGGAWWNPVLFAAHDIQTRFNKNGVHAWQQFDSSSDPLIPLKPYAPDYQFQDTSKGLVSISTNYGEIRDANKGSLTNPLPFRHVAVAAGNGFRYNADGEWEEDEDLLVSNTVGAANVLAEKLKPYIGAGMNLASLASNPWVMGGLALLVTSQLGVFGKRYQIF